MARDYGKVFTRAWGDPDFKALSMGAQHLYMQLLSQPDMTMAGVLTTAVPRWVGQTRGSDAVSVQRALDELEKARFVVSDPATMETLIRSFVRNDLGWRSPKTMIGIESSVRSILSNRLKSVIAVELSRCDTSTVSDAVSERTGKSSREVVEGLISGLRRDFADTPSGVSDVVRNTPSDTPSDTPWDGGFQLSLTETATATANETATANATAEDSALSLITTPASRETSPRQSRSKYDYPDEFEKFWQAYPVKNDKRKALTAWKRAIKQVSNDVLVEAAARYRDDPNRDDRYTKLAASWLHAGSWENGPLPSRSPANPRHEVPDTFAASRAYREISTQAAQIGPSPGLSPQTWAPGPPTNFQAVTGPSRRLA